MTGGLGYSRARVEVLIQVSEESVNGAASEESGGFSLVKWRFGYSRERTEWRF